MARKEFSPHNDHHPHWHREHQGEHRYPVAIVVFIVILLQSILPDELSISYQTAVSGLELLLLALGSIAGSMGSLLQEFKTKEIAIKKKNAMGLSDFIN